MDATNPMNVVAVMAAAWMLVLGARAQQGVVALGQVTLGHDTYTYRFVPERQGFELTGHGRTLRTKANHDGTIGLEMVSGPQVRNLGFRSLALQNGALVVLS
jgi:hypothetical protein